MEKKQQTQDQPVVEQAREERVEEPKVRRGRLRIEALEERVAPSAIWSD